MGSKRKKKEGLCNEGLDLLLHKGRTRSHILRVVHTDKVLLERSLSGSVSQEQVNIWQGENIEFISWLVHRYCSVKLANTPESLNSIYGFYPAG